MDIKYIMDTTAKIHLSTEEAGLIDNADWILTKHSIIRKVYQMFGEINDLMKNEFARVDHLMEGIQQMNGKISRGENYRFLPYIILDYPSHFTRSSIFAVRTMFWWGNFFSITLHLSGDHKKKFVNNNQDLFLFLKKNHFFICVNDEEWEHHFGENNYLPAADITDFVFGQVIVKPFFKVAKKLPLKEWENVSSFIMNGFKEILELLQINFPAGKKDLSPGFPIAGSGL